tara:strand:+ start:1978 stop:2214 length:237 start_codon:yes stop_codon:yes gene_type:complete
MSNKPPMYPDKELAKIYEELFEIAASMSQSTDPGLVAASMMAIGSRIYKTILTGEDYEKMMEKIAKTDVKPFKKETLQ